MDKRMHLSEKISMENNAANQESNGEMFVSKVANCGLVLKFKVDKYGTPPPKHTISSQEVMMPGGKQSVKEPLENSEANNCSANAIPLLEQSEISAAEARSNKISLFGNANKVAPPDEIAKAAAMVNKCTTVVADQIVSSASIAVGSSNGVCRMNKTTSSFEKANKMEHYLATTENGANSGGDVVHTCNECGKSFKEKTSLNGHIGTHRREDNKRMRRMNMMAEQQPTAVEASQVWVTNNRETKRTNWFAARAILRMYKELKDISLDEETDDDMREIADILATMSQTSRKDDSAVHVSSSAPAAKSSVCKICKRTFPTYHGLGGHMSIHNNKPAAKNSLLEAGAGSSSGGREPCTWKYVCVKCNEKFATGQSLGRHKRKHWFDEQPKKMALLLEDGSVKPLSQLPHEAEGSSSGLQVMMPADENIQQPTTETGLVVAADAVPLAFDAVQQPQQAMGLGGEIELPVSSGVSDEDVA